ncbi:MAG: SDR family NAD(P)-dependent oxidoreductase [Deltaproteobacteria bacterium]|nr:SDR family NAD(P)-dependent oxidoreductase [Deltaproteobacteria bacterium]
MDDFQGRVAVVTGGGSGIGAAMARAFARLGSRIVLADLDRAGMDGVVSEIAAGGGRAIGIECDVTDLRAVERLADRTFRELGAAHILCNNAGVGMFGPLAAATENDWKWVMSVNVWGVVHGIHAFLARMIEQKQGGHIVNTASMAGLAGMPGLGVYCASKFAVVGLTESLARELKGTGIGASVLCPMIVNTRIDSSDRNRPKELQDPGAKKVSINDVAMTVARVIEPEEVAERVVRGIREKALYILTHSESRDVLRRRAQRLAEAAEKLATG